MEGRRSDEFVKWNWKDKREVLTNTITNMHLPEMVDVTNKNGSVTKNTNLFHGYNNGMPRADRSDQVLVLYYGYSKNTLRRYKKIGFYLLEI